MAPLWVLYIVILTYIFNVTKFLDVQYLENGVSCRKIPQYDFYRGWYSLSDGVSPVFLSRNFDLNFQGQTFKILISRKRWELAHKCSLRLLCRLIFAIEWHNWDRCNQRPWPLVIQKCAGSGLRPSNLPRLVRPSLRNCSCCSSSFLTLIFVFKAKLLVFCLRIFRK